jgi:hypothetical protein
MAGARETLNGGLFAKLLFDCMFSADFAASIRAQGFDVAEARHLPRAIQRNDYAVLKQAILERRVLITCNCDDPDGNFCVIHEEWLRAGKNHFGIVLVPQFRFDNHHTRWAIRRRLLDFLNSRTWDELQNQLLWLP